jgi:oxaloacetate decarboxylase gamma subunit
MFDGLNLMLYGMGFVFTFLTLLVFSTKGMSALINRWFVTPDPAIVKIGTAGPGLRPAQLASDDKQLIAVLTAAVHRHRRDKQS